MKNSKVLIFLCVICAAAAAIFLRSYFSVEKNTAAAALKAYQLYAAGEKLREITLYFGNPESDGLKEFKNKIFESEQQINQVKQVLLLLLSGPEQNGMRVIPEGTVLRDVYFDATGTVYVDLTQEISLNSQGGSTAEYLTVYSILNTVFENFSWVRGVRILVDGKEAKTLSGHISLEGIFRPGGQF
jgi:spore germination protein GerM